MVRQKARHQNRRSNLASEAKAPSLVCVPPQFDKYLRFLGAPEQFTAVIPIK